MGVGPKAWAQILIGYWKLGPSIIGYLIVDGFGPKIDVFFLALLGPSTTTTMAEATMPQLVKHNPTNPNTKCFGPPTGEMQTILANLNQRAKSDRLTWLKGWAWHKMPEGPYPVFVTGFGWMKAYLLYDEYHAVYLPREDLNLDVEVLKVIWSKDGMNIECRQHFTESQELLEVKAVMETYDFESKKLKTSLEKRIHITPNEVRSMIRDEVANWESYDEWFNLRIQSEKMERDRKKLDERRPKKPKKTPRRTKRRLSFPGPKKKKSKPSGPNVAGPKVADPKVAGPKVSGPKVRVVTALDHANDASDDVNANILKTMAAQKVLRNDMKFMMTLQAKPIQVADAIFQGATKEEMRTIALELAGSCRQNDLETIMLKHRDTALKNLSTQYQAFLAKAIEAQGNVDKLRAEIDEEVDLGPYAEDGPDVQEAAGPNEQDVLNAAFGLVLVGPKNDAGDGPKNDAGDGPTTDAGDGPIDLTTTPKPFMEQPHFIRSKNPRSSTGYKGVVKDKRGGFRAKWSGKHIGRYETKAQACQAYYDYCMKHALIGPR